MLNIRKHFPMFESNPNLIYFDNAATTFKPQEVIDTVVDFYTKKTSNVHRGDYDISYQISNEYENTRAAVAKFINAQTKEIVFTHGASESLNIVALSYGLQKLKCGDVILTSESEHASSILPWFKVAEKTGAVIKFIKLNGDGSFNIENFKQALNSDVKIINIAHVSNVLGYILPIKEICKLAHEKGILVSVDGAQSVPHLKIDVRDLNVDFLSFSSHKMYGPSGVGVLYAKYELLEMMEPYIYGGGSNARFDICGNILLKSSPYKFESGTPNIEGILGLKAAIEFLNNNDFEKLIEHEEKLTSYLISKLLKLENVILYNPESKCSIVSFNIKGIFAQDVSSYLNKHNICVRSGNHCAKVLVNVLKVSETIRASVSFYNTYEEIDYFINILKDITLEKCVEVFL